MKTNQDKTLTSKSEKTKRIKKKEKKRSMCRSCRICSIEDTVQEENQNTRNENTESITEGSRMWRSWQAARLLVSHMFIYTTLSCIWGMVHTEIHLITRARDKLYGITKANNKTSWHDVLILSASHCVCEWMSFARMIVELIGMRTLHITAVCVYSGNVWSAEDDGDRWKIQNEGEWRR